MSLVQRNPVSSPPIHPLAALATIALDGFFSIFELLDPLVLLFTCVGLGLLGFITTTMVQHYLDQDEWGVAAAKGLVMGIFAGVPYAVGGTAIGIPLLIWAGLHNWIKLPVGGNSTIIDVIPTQPEIEKGKEDESEY